MNHVNPQKHNKHNRNIKWQQINTIKNNNLRKNKKYIAHYSIRKKASQNKKTKALNVKNT